MHRSVTRSSLIGLTVVTAIALTTTLIVLVARPGFSSSSAWSMLPNLADDVPSVSTSTILGGRVLFLGGTGAGPDDRSPSSGASVDVVERTSRKLAPPPIANGLAFSVAQAVGDQVVVIGNPCTSGDEMSSGDCFQTSWVGELYSVTSDKWTPLPAPRLQVGVPIISVGVAGTTAVFALRDTGELLGLDVTTKAWTPLAPAVAPADVSVCSMGGTPVALTNSYLVDGEEVAQRPAPEERDGATVSGPDPVWIKPTVSIFEAGAWQKRMSFDAESSAPFELACGATLAYVLVHSTLDQLSLGTPVVSLRAVNPATSGATSIATAPVNVDADMWQHKTVVGDDLALLSSLGNGNQLFQSSSQTWLAMPSLPRAFDELALEVLGSVEGNIVVRNRGDAADPGGELAVLAAPKNGVFK